MCNAILALLASERYQRLTIARSEVVLITTLFVFSCTHDISALKSTVFNSALQFELLVESPNEEEEEEALSQLRSSLSARLWDISARPEFALPHTLTTDLLSMLRCWLSAPQPQMQLCACSIFRNLTISHQATSDLIRQTHINDLLIDIIRNSSDVQVLEEALRLYRNLAVHPDYKIMLADNDAITILWSKHPVQIVQYAAARVIRQLLTGESFNVKLFLTLKPKQAEDLKPGNTYIARLMNLYANTVDLGTKMEVAQIVVAMWRAGTPRTETQGAAPINIDDAIRQAETVGANIAKPVMAMITESENPSLVTQGWLGLALMAGTKEGSVAVANILCDADNQVVLQKTLLEDHGESLAKDGNNASILLRLLKKNHVRAETKYALDGMLTLYSI